MHKYDIKIFCVAIVYAFNCFLYILYAFDQRICVYTEIIVYSSLYFNLYSPQV